MTAKALPDGWKLARGVDKKVLTDDYDHWTVADVIEMLREYPQDARVWVRVGANKLSPVEMIAGSEGEVVL